MQAMYKNSIGKRISRNSALVFEEFKLLKIIFTGLTGAFYAFSEDRARPCRPLEMKIFVWLVYLVGFFPLVLWFFGLFVCLLIRHYLELGEQKTNLHVANKRGEKNGGQKSHIRKYSLTFMLKCRGKEGKD